MSINLFYNLIFKFKGKFLFQFLIFNALIMFYTILKSKKYKLIMFFSVSYIDTIRISISIKLGS